MRDAGVDNGTRLCRGHTGRHDAVVGTVTEGKFADPLLPTDPRRDLDVVIDPERIVAVIKEGRRVR